MRYLLSSDGEHRQLADPHFLADDLVQPADYQSFHPLMLITVGFLTAPARLLVLGIWVLYRVLRGWTALRVLQPLP